MADSLTRQDVMFLQQMIEHHQEAVQMSTALLAQQPGRTGNAVSDLARAIIAAQTPEIKLMTGWLVKADKSVTPPAGMKDKKGDM